MRELRRRKVGVFNAGFLQQHLCRNIINNNNQADSPTTQRENVQKREKTTQPVVQERFTFTKRRTLPAGTARARA